MQTSFLDCDMRGIKIKQTSFRSRSTTLGEEEEKKMPKIRLLGYIVLQFIILRWKDMCKV